jgi:hypothetical protein
MGFKSGAATTVGRRKIRGDFESTGSLGVSGSIRGHEIFLLHGAADLDQSAARYLPSAGQTNLVEYTAAEPSFSPYPIGRYLAADWSKSAAPWSRKISWPRIDPETPNDPVDSKSPLIFLLPTVVAAPALNPIFIFSL